MNKNISITSLVAITMFLALTFATTTVRGNFSGADKFGFPFVFFSASNTMETVNDTSFSFIGLLGNLSICFAIAFGLVFVFSLLKIEKSKKAIA